MGELINMVGEVRGRLTVVARSDNSGTRAAWLCRCGCGNTVVVEGKKLRSGHTKSCGCYRAEVTAPKTGNNNRLSQDDAAEAVKRNGFTLIGPFKGILKKATVQCDSCGLVIDRRIETSMYGVSGCPRCAKANNGFINSDFLSRNPDIAELDACIYMFEFQGGGEHFWKVGITRQDISQRLRKIPYQMLSMETVSMKLADAYEKEKILKRLHKAYRYRPLIAFNGHSECFSVPIDIN